jgi:hypothetical protein
MYKIYIKISKINIMSTNSVFMKKSQPNYKIEYSSILQTIPENSYSEEQLDKADKVETRWRFLSIPTNDKSPESNNNKTKKLVEISRKRPNNEREYLNKNMKWIVTVVDPIFDKFVVKKYYYYSDQ